MLPDVLPNENGAGNVNIHGTNHSFLGNFYTNIKVLNQLNRNAFFLVPIVKQNIEYMLFTISHHRYLIVVLNRITREQVLFSVGI